MLDRIHAGNLTPEEYVKLAKNKESKVRLMGFGHRVYKNFDPRAQILQKVAEELVPQLCGKDPLLDIARRLEEIARSDSYFIERNLYPNVDFYSGIILRAIGIPVNMFTVMFSIGRLPGWIAQWWEQNHTPGTRIARPRQIYVGNRKQDYLPKDQRG
jgi:citrate synthase